MALSCRWFGVLVRKCGGLEPPRVGPRGRIFASFWSTKCFTSPTVATEVKHLTQVSDALMPRIGPTLCGSSPPHFRTNTPNQRHLTGSAMSLPSAARADRGLHHMSAWTRLCLRFEAVRFRLATSQPHLPRSIKCPESGHKVSKAVRAGIQKPCGRSVRVRSNVLSQQRWVFMTGIET